MGYVDLHSHVLFGLDDGAPDHATALAMLDGLAALGVTEQCATPHQKASQYMPAWDAVEATFATLDASRKPHHPTLRLAAENMWDDVFYRRAADDTIPGYRGTTAFLVEIPPPLIPPRMGDRLFEFGRAGKVPVLAHPERYHALWDDDELARSLRRVCAFVIDLPALAGFHGRRESKQARHLLEIGLAAAVATDAHQPGDIQQSAQGLAWIEKKLGHATVVRLFDHAPRAILAGELPTDLPARQKLAMLAIRTEYPSMRRFSMLGILAIMLLGPALAEARSEGRVLAYSRDSVWGTAVRFVAVDERARILDKDADAGYLLFELRDEGKIYRGSLELVTVKSDGNSSIRFVITLVDRPSWMELGMLKRLEQKLRAELGSPNPPKPKPTEPPKDDSEKKDDKDKDSNDKKPAKPEGGGGSGG